MIIYEVNIHVQESIFDNYYAWLLKHIEEMLTFEGFKKAEIGLVENQENSNEKKLRISYAIHSYSDLENYFNTHAPRMRAEGMEKFPNQFSATRRVILDTILLERIG